MLTHYLYTMHNAFCEGTSKYGQDVEDFAPSLIGLFKLSAGQRDDYRQIQMNLDLKQDVRKRSVKRGRLSKK